MNSRSLNKQFNGIKEKELKENKFLSCPRKHKYKANRNDKDNTGLENIIQ